MKYKVSVYPESFKGKDKSFMKESTKKITKFIPKHGLELSVAELAAAIDNMQVFCPAVFKGDHKSQDELEAIQFFALDFDGGIDIDTAKARAKRYKLVAVILRGICNCSQKGRKDHVLYVHKRIPAIRELSDNDRQGLYIFYNQ